MYAYFDTEQKCHHIFGSLILIVQGIHVVFDGMLIVELKRLCTVNLISNAVNDLALSIYCLFLFLLFISINSASTVSPSEFARLDFIKYLLFKLISPDDLLFVFSKSGCVIDKSRTHAEFLEFQKFENFLSLFGDTLSGLPAIIHTPRPPQYLSHRPHLFRH